MNSVESMILMAINPSKNITNRYDLIESDKIVNGFIRGYEKYQREVKFSHEIGKIFFERSSEGFLETIKTIGKKVIDFIKTLIKKFIEFCKKVWNWIKGLFTGKKTDKNGSSTNNKETNKKDLPPPEIVKQEVEKKPEKPEEIEIENFRNRNDFFAHDIRLLDKLAVLSSIANEGSQVDLYASIEKDVLLKQLALQRRNKVLRILGESLDNPNITNESIDQYARKFRSFITNRDYNGALKQVMIDFPEAFPENDKNNFIKASDLLLIFINPISGNQIRSIGDDFRALCELFPDADYEEITNVNLSERKKLIASATNIFFYESDPPEIIKIDPLEIYTTKNINMISNSQMTENFTKAISSQLSTLERELKIWENSLSNLDAQYNSFVSYWQDCLKEGKDPSESWMTFGGKHDRNLKDTDRFRDYGGNILTPARNKKYTENIEFKKGEKANYDPEYLMKHTLSHINGEYEVVRGYMQLNISVYSIFVHSIQNIASIIKKQESAIISAKKSLFDFYQTNNLKPNEDESPVESLSITTEFLKRVDYTLSSVDKEENVNNVKYKILMSTLKVVNEIADIDLNKKNDNNMPYLRDFLSKLADHLEMKISLTNDSFYRDCNSLFEIVTAMGTEFSEFKTICIDAIISRIVQLNS